MSEVEVGTELTLGVPLVTVTFATVDWRLYELCECNFWHVCRRETQVRTATRVRGVVREVSYATVTEDSSSDVPSDGNVDCSTVTSSSDRHD